MKLRTSSTYLGPVAGVPQNVQRIDQDSTHGWQLRYGKEPTAWFNDVTLDRPGIELALSQAIEALRKRVKKHPAPTGLRTTTVPWKGSNLPPGVFGPVLRKSGTNTPYWAINADLPKPTGGTKKRSFYIGTENTASPEREAAAVAKAVAARQEAERKVQLARTREMRAAAETVLQK